MHFNSTNRFFVTGTDTEIGKTTVTQYLIHSLQQQGKTAMGCKPIACGLDENEENEDVLIYQKINSFPLKKEDINPIRLRLPCSPNIASLHEGKALDFNDLIDRLTLLSHFPVDYLFFEGCGGWYVPLNDRQTLADIVITLNLPLLFVVGIQVGCLNKALLTWEAFQKRPLNIMGWIANIIDPATPAIPEHITTLKNWISAPHLGTLPHHIKCDSHSYIDLESFLR